MKKKTHDSEAGKGSKSFKAYVISTVVLVLAVLLCAIVTIQTLVQGYVSIFGYSAFRVVTGSMEPTMSVGAVLLSKDVDIRDVAVGDIICFRSRESSHYGSIVTHRVVSITASEDGSPMLESRGDANYSSDPYLVEENNLIGKVIWYTGKEGFFNKVLSFMSGKIGFLAVIVIPVLVIAGLILHGVGRNIRGELDDTLDMLSRDNKNSNKNEKKKDPSPDDPLPGYKYLTRRDYNEIYEALRREIWKELNCNVEANERKTEYSGENSQD